MGRFILRRILEGIPLLLLVSILIFVMLQLSGDPLATLGGRTPPRSEDVARLRKALGLDQPIFVQYLYWLVGNDWMPLDVDGDGEPDPLEERVPREIRFGVLRGDFGTSISTREPALDLIMERMGNTLLLTITAEVAIVVLSLAIGIYAAVSRYSVGDTIVASVTFIVYSMPVFWIALILQYVLGAQLRILPTVGMYDPIVGKTFEQVALHLILPVTTITLISVAGYSRYIRSSMLEVMNSDYVRTGRAKGLTERRVLFVHALKNASIPIVTLIGLDLPFLLAGAVVTEQIFGWPGMGRLFINSLGRSDFPVLMGLLMMIAVAVVATQIILDVVYSWLDPRIRYGSAL
jgi:peptide/nickel transport system permease protein